VAFEAGAFGLQSARSCTAGEPSDENRTEASHAELEDFLHAQFLTQNQRRLEVEVMSLLTGNDWEPISSPPPFLRRAVPARRFDGRGVQTCPKLHCWRPYQTAL